MPTPDPLDRIIDDTIAPQALETDQLARFPQQAIAALSSAGLLGLLSATEVGGQGQDLALAAQVVERIAQHCPSTAMVLTMHYAATVLIEKYGRTETRQAIAAGHHLSTLAWSEAGSRSHFWAPVGTARVAPAGDLPGAEAAVLLTADKSMVTSAHHADSYVWSSRPLAADGASTLWLVPRGLAGLHSPEGFNGMGLRGNDSAPVQAREARLPASARLGADGEGAAIMNNDELPVFCTLVASASIGLMDGALTRAIAHIKRTRFSDSGGGLADLPTLRAYLARARIQADQARTLRDDTVQALQQGRADALLRVLQVKASAAEAALAVTETCMRICGGAAFRKEAGIERLFRDARAASVMAPTSDVLFDFIGRTLCELPLA